MAEPIDHLVSHESSRRRNCRGECPNCIWPSGHDPAQSVCCLWEDEAWRMGYKGIANFILVTLATVRMTMLMLAK